MPDVTWWGLAADLLLLTWPAQNLLLALFGWRPMGRRSRKAIEITGKPVFWIVVPALNEERVVGATVRAALALDAPETPVRVLVVDDASDDGTPDVLAGIDDPRLHVLRRELPAARIGKGHALNAAFQLIRDTARAEGTEHDTILGVIDGDGRGTPGMLVEIARLFDDPKVGGVQCRVRIHNRDRLLGFLQDIEFGCVADASQTMRDLVGSVDLGGNGQFVRLTELDRFGDEPWSACLVEDLELGLRMHLAGCRIRYARNATITQQGLVDARRLVRQRTRWGQGNLQCMRYVPRLIFSRNVNSIALVEFLYYLINPWLVVPLSAGVVGMAIANVFGAATGNTLNGLVAVGTALPAALFAWCSALLAPGLMWALVHWKRFGDEPLFRTVVVGMVYPVFLLIGVAATWRALFRHAAGKRGWVKTERLAEVETAEPATEQLVEQAA